MASSMLTGDRRWAPTRKLTVLGKVPKPINLPSQRLENHGLDPNVEIVPKGTLTWGSRATAPNAWGTSSISSPHTDGSSGSPSHRPSSGGDTRPSTAGSDRSHEPISNAWGPNSRPSSASGILASSQISAASTRPRSAETRPGSSQLSRFAENSADSMVAWNTAGTAEKMGTASSKASGFTLTSGDFPTLGSDKNSDTQSQRGHSSHGRPHSSQGRPASSSGTDSKPIEPLESQFSEHLGHGTVNTWKAENSPYAGHDAPLNMENWHRDPHPTPPYPNMNIAPPPYDSWHNPSFRPADGSWYRGGVAGGPYRPHGPPGSYPFDYPHGPPRPLSNSQFPRQDARPGGFYPNNNEAYRPYPPPERYMGPNHADISVRPGPYPGSLTYEGYYGPPRPNFFSSMDRETSMMGMARPVHNQYQIQHQNYDSVNFHARSGGYASPVNKEQTEPNRAHESHGQYRVLLKQHDDSDSGGEQRMREHSVADGVSHLERYSHPGVSSEKRDVETDGQMHEAVVSPSSSREAVPFQSSKSNNVRNLVDSSKAADDGLLRRPEAGNVQGCKLQQYPIIRKNAILMEKVESLNNKTRTADNHSEGGPVSSKEKSTFSNNITARPDRSIKLAGASVSSTENAFPGHNLESANIRESNASTEDKNGESIYNSKVITTSVNSVNADETSHFDGQKKVYDAKGVDHRSKSRSDRHVDDERTKRTQGCQSSMNTSRASIKGKTPESNSLEEALEKQDLYLEAGSGDGSHTIPSLDTVDHKIQRAKMKEIAIERAKQLQEEEEERIREQKAKALAKLEELNRRTLAESFNLKSSSPPWSNDPQGNSNESEHSAASVAFVEASTGSSVSGSGSVKQASVSSIDSSVMQRNRSSTVEQENSDTSKITFGTTAEIQLNTIVKEKQVDYRRKNSLPQENNMDGKQTTSDKPGSPKDAVEIVENASLSKDTLPNNENPPVHHKRNNRSTKNSKNNKLDEISTMSTLSSLPHAEKPQIESMTTKPVTLAEVVSVPSQGSNETVGTQRSRELQDTPANDAMSETTDGSHGRVSNNWKPRSQKKTTRNQQANKPVPKYHTTEAVMWAPVKPLIKSDTSDEIIQKTDTEATKPSCKSGHDLLNPPKVKKAEIERYVPKPVAKELLQQVKSHQQTSPSQSKAASSKSETVLPNVESGRHDGATGGKSAAASATRNAENRKHNKHGQTNASWRQRSSAEPSSLEGCVSSDQAKVVTKDFDELQTSSTDNFPKVQLTHTDDGWNDSNSVLPSESVTSATISKSYGASRQRRQPYKVPRLYGNNNTTDSIDMQQGITDKCEHLSRVTSHKESEGRNVLKAEMQNAAVENIKPQWQPKPQAYSHDRQGNWGSRGGQRGAAQYIEDAPLMNDEDNYRSSLAASANDLKEAHHQEFRRGRKVAADSAKDQNADESTANVGHQWEQVAPLAVNQRGQHNGRFQRGYNYNYRGQDLVQDGSKQNFQMDGDKRKNKQQAEYPRIGSYDKHTDTFQQNPTTSESVQEGSRPSGSRYGGRGRHFPQGGGQSYGRSSIAAAHAGNSYNSRE